MHHTLEFWTIIRTESLKPLSSNGGKIKYSSALYKKFFSTSKIPGETIDRIDNHFRCVSEGSTPTNSIILGKGRIFSFESLNPDGSYLSPQQCLAIFQRIDSILNESDLGECVPVLTNDERTNWAKNRNRLIELSPHNKETLHLIESAIVVLTFDENEPTNYEEVCKLSMEGDFISKWADRSSILVSYKNGRVAYIGEASWHLTPAFMLIFYSNFSIPLMMELLAFHMLSSLTWVCTKFQNRTIGMVLKSKYLVSMSWPLIWMMAWRRRFRRLQWRVMRGWVGILIT